MKVFCITNNKGGVAKTTTTINIGYALSRKGHKVLIIDCDPQCNTTYALLGTLDSSESLFEVLQDGMPIAQTIKSTKNENLFLVPCSINLSAADVMMASTHGREQKLAKALQSVKDYYDFVIIDTPPSLGLLTINALVACTDVIIPFTLSTFALIGSKILEDTMQELRVNLDVKLPILGVLATMDEHTSISKDILESLKVKYKDKVFNTVIPRNVAIEYAHNQIDSIFDYEKGSKAAQAYEALADEILGRVK